MLKDRVVLAYVLIVLVAALGFWRLESVIEKQGQITDKLCHAGQDRWQLAHDVVIVVTQPIPFAAGDAAALARLNARNRQLADERDTLLTELGAKPTC